MARPTVKSCLAQESFNSSKSCRVVTSLLPLFYQVDRISHYQQNHSHSVFTHTVASRAVENFLQVVTLTLAVYIITGTRLKVALKVTTLCEFRAVALDFGKGSCQDGRPFLLQTFDACIHVVEFRSYSADARSQL